MATVKISELPAILGANTADTDVLPIVDVSGNITNKITRAEFFKNIQGNVGIGTSNPTSLLTVYNATTSIITVLGDSGTAFIAARSSNDTTAPGVNFRKYRGTTATPLTVATGDNLGNSNYIGYDGSSLITAAQITGIAETVTGTGNISGALTFLTRPAGTGTSVTERLRITDIGRVGLGVTNPAARLQVAALSSSSATVIAATEVDYLANFRSSQLVYNPVDTTGTTFGFSNSNLGALSFLNTTNAVIGTNGATPLAFATTSLERMRITSAGNVGIGNTAPVVPLHVTGDTITTGVVYNNQPAQTSKAAAATLTIAELETGIIQYTGAAATLTLPTGTLIEGGVPASFPVNMAFDFSVINTGSGTATLGTATGLTLVGSMAVTAGVSGMFRVRKTATNVYTVYRIG